MADELDPNAMLVSWLRFRNMLDHELGREVYEWEDLQEDEQSAWGDAFAIAQKIVAEADGVPYDTLARQVYEAYHRVMSPTGLRPEWDIRVPDEERLRWQFLVRHMVNLLLIDPEEDGSPQSHEEQLLSLFTDKLKALQGV